MSTLIAVYNSEGCQGRCDAKCYDAIGDDCDCICGGLNHGKGIQTATKNLSQVIEKMDENLDLFCEQHGLVRSTVVARMQLSFF